MELSNLLNALDVLATNLLDEENILDYEKCFARASKEYETFLKQWELVKNEILDEQKYKEHLIKKKKADDEFIKDCVRSFGSIYEWQHRNPFKDY